MVVLNDINKSDKILLHSCCAPCSSAIIECMLQNDIKPTIYYYNPNIYPTEEYEIRKSENKRYAVSLGLDFIDGDSNYTHWRESMRGLENEPERGARCMKCFLLRLTEVARYAHENGYNVITTTLVSSRWKDIEQIFSAGRIAVSNFSDVTFWEHNWRKGGLNERRSQIIKEYNFYNQKYCGCEFSVQPPHLHNS